METIEIKKDLLSEMMKEESSSPKEMLKQVFKDTEETLIIILLFKNDNFKYITKPYNIEIYDRKMFEWVESACQGYEIKKIECDKNSSIVSLIKPFLNEKKNTLVLYSDTPLLTNETIDEAIDYFNVSGMNVLKLPRGWVFKTEYIKTADSISAVQTRQFNEFEFKSIFNLKELESQSQILKQRIIDNLYENEVLISDEKTVYIGADVIIEPGTKIEANNIITGMTYIGRNCILEPLNNIKDSIISNNCVIKSSRIIQSKITENMVVGPFEVIENKQS